METIGRMESIGFKRNNRNDERREMFLYVSGGLFLLSVYSQFATKGKCTVEGGTKEWVELRGY